MLINQTHKFIFLKTHKTASTSIENYFSSYNVDADYTITKTVLDNITTKHGPTATAKYHASAEDIINVIGEEEWDLYSKITSVRNPYEKIVSGYFFIKEFFSIPTDTIDSEKRNFNEWVESYNDQYLIELCDNYIYRLHDVVCVDHIIKVENLNNDLQLICKQLNLPYKNNINRLNSTSRPKWATCELMYSNNSKNIIKNMFQFELEYFNYSFPKESPN